MFLFDGFSDWEIAYLTPEIKKSERVEWIYFSRHGESVQSIGGLHVLPDTSLEAIKTHEVEMLILPGGITWEKEENSFIDSFVNELFIKEKTIVSICGVTIYLERKGILNTLKHTRNDLHYLKSVAPEYSGEKQYVNSLAVTDKNLITANEIAPIEFAREIFTKLKLRDDKEIEKWFQLFKNGIWSE